MIDFIHLIYIIEVLIQKKYYSISTAVVEVQLERCHLDYTGISIIRICFALTIHVGRK